MKTPESNRVLTKAELERNYKNKQYFSMAKKGFAIIGVLTLVYIGLQVCERYIITLNQVNGVSMEETIKDGSWLVVNRVPVTLGKIISKPYTPARGDIVTIDEVYGHRSQTESDGSQRQLAKRVIGLPGERVVIRHGKITVHNKEHPRGFNPDTGEWQKTMIKDLSGDTLDIQLLSNEIFVIGDNRLVSVDSRMNGPIAISNIQGLLVPSLPL